MLSDDQKRRVRVHFAKRWSLTAIAERVGVPVAEVQAYVDEAKLVAPSRAVSGDDWANFMKRRYAKREANQKKVSLAPVRGL